MRSPRQISDLRRIKWTLYFLKAHDKSYIQKYNIYLLSVSKVMAIQMQFGHFLARTITNMAISRDSDWSFVIFIFKILLSIKC